MNSKKFGFILFASILLAIKLTAQDAVHYDIKCGTISYIAQSTISLPGMPPLKVMVEGISSFDDYGERIATHYTEKTDPGETSLNRVKHYYTLRIPGLYCLIDSDTNEKIDEENLSATTKEIVAGHSITDYNHLTGLEAELYISKFIDNTTYLGKSCKKYRVTEKIALYGSEDIVTVWNNIVLERKSKTAAFLYDYKVVKIDETPPDASLFKIPEINQ